MDRRPGIIVMPTWTPPGDAIPTIDLRVSIAAPDPALARVRQAQSQERHAREARTRGYALADAAMQEELERATQRRIELLRRGELTPPAKRPDVALEPAYTDSLTPAGYVGGYVTASGYAGGSSYHPHAPRRRHRSGPTMSF